ncbi:prolipoprotein diacylglyceryl transferase [Candidatus Peregrinibacteria bacterium]|nr:prolipoprotein diacylglyceryl transferase [Candidatus Peregrinibacteria bacterium]
MFEALPIGPFILWTHLFFLLIATALSTEFFFRLAESANLSLQQFSDNARWHVLGFLLGGRIAAIVAEYRVYLRDPLRVFIVWDGQFSFLGAAIGIAIVLYIFGRTSRTTFLQWLDVLLPATTFGLVFDWIGKFAAGQAYGLPTNMFWGITYDAMAVRYAVPIHPVQLYYAFFYLVLTFVLLIVRKRSRRAGAETLAGIATAALGTIFLESFRGDFSIPVFATGLDLLILILLFLSLGIVAVIEMRLPQKLMIAIEAVMTLVCAGYLIARPWLPFEAYELRFSQLLAVLALLGTVVYVVVHRQRYPHL